MTDTPNSRDLPSLRPETIARGDPLLRLLTRSKASPVLMGVLYSTSFTLLRMLAAWRAGHLRTTGMVLGFLDSLGMYSNLVFVVVIWAYYMWMPRGIATVINGLVSNKVIGTPTSSACAKRGDNYSYASFMDEMQAVFYRWWWTAASVAIAVGGTFILVMPGYMERMEKQDSWAMATPLSLALSLLWVLMGIYCVILLLFYCGLGIYWLSRLFRDFTVYVRPLHPDRAGGLSPIGKFSLTLSYIITLIGLMLVIAPVGRNYVTYGTFLFRWTSDILAGLGLYIMAAPAAFFAPLSVAHDVMKTAKGDLLLQIARRFDVEYAKIQNALDERIQIRRALGLPIHDRHTSIQDALGKDITSLENSSKTLKELQSLHEMTSKFPVWPFNTQNIVRFSTSFVSPIVLAVATDLLGKLVNP